MTSTKSRRNAKRHSAKPSEAASDTVHRPHATVMPAQVPARLAEENRRNTNQVLAALTKAAVSIGVKENAIEVVEVMERLQKMQMIAEDRQAEREFGLAKVAVSNDIPTIPKTKSYEFVDKANQKQLRFYSDRVDIESVLDPLTRKHGFSKEYSSKTDAKGWTCQVLTVRHAGGHSAVYESPYQPLDTTGAKNNSQAASSTAEYGMKQVLKGAFNILGVDFDDHGDNVNMPHPDAAKAHDKFADRVKGEAGKAQPQNTEPKQKMTLDEAAAAVEQKIKSADKGNAGKVMMTHIKVIAAMEADDKLKAKAAELRQYCDNDKKQPAEDPADDAA